MAYRVVRDGISGNILSSDDVKNSRASGVREAAGRSMPFGSGQWTVESGVGGFKVTK